MTVAEVFTQWTTVEPYVDTFETWIAEEDRLRIAAYQKYEQMYWNAESSFELLRRESDGASVLIPKPMTVVDTTAYYLLKDLKITSVNEELTGEFGLFLEAFLKREAFYSRFNTAKHDGIMRGDWLFHLTADPNKPEGSRISLTSLDPAVYFPEYDPDDMETLVGCQLVQQWPHPDDPDKVVVRVLHYTQPGKLDLNSGDLTVYREEALWEIEDWFDPEKQVKVKQILPYEALPSDITAIPVYHFKNRESDGYPFGNSELRGLERVFQAINQAISDEEIALALSGLGVYVTDAGRPVNEETGQETDWVAFPGAVWEMPGATLAKRLDGVASVTPVQDHLNYLGKAINEGSGTSDVALGNIDANTAESGVALAIKFIPTLAKIEDRDKTGLAILEQMFYDWKFWVKAYESKDFTAQEILITLGDKLPINRAKVIEELNNMYDREVISAQFYRDELKRRLGYDFPEDIQKQILEEKKALAEIALIGKQDPSGDDEARDTSTLPPDQLNRSNNRNRVNESDGTEIDAD